MRKAKPAASPDAYVAALDGWHRKCVEALRTTVRASAVLEEVVKWGHLVYIANGPVLLIRAEDRPNTIGLLARAALVAQSSQVSSRVESNEMATLELRKGMTVAAATVRRLTREAVGLNDKLGDPRLAAKRD